MHGRTAYGTAPGRGLACGDDGARIRRGGRAAWLLALALAVAVAGASGGTLQGCGGGTEDEEGRGGKVEPAGSPTLSDKILTRMVSEHLGIPAEPCVGNFEERQAVLGRLLDRWADDRLKSFERDGWVIGMARGSAELQVGDVIRRMKILHRGSPAYFDRWWVFLVARPSKLEGRPVRPR
jgi:hypothetical protein